MPNWLFKSEPSCYSYADLEREGSTTWDGITNAQARLNLREVKPGDRIWFYHTGDEKAIVGVMKAASGPKMDSNGEDAKAVVVDVIPVRKLKRPISLSRIKGDKRLADWLLVRNSRLSVVPVSHEQWKVVEELAKTPDTA